MYLGNQRSSAEYGSHATRIVWKAGCLETCTSGLGLHRVKLPGLHHGLTGLRPKLKHTCHIYVLPKLYGASWTDDQIQDQHSFTDGRIVPTAKKIRPLKQKYADYRLG